MVAYANPFSGFFLIMFTLCCLALVGLVDVAGWLVEATLAACCVGSLSVAVAWLAEL